MERGREKMDLSRKSPNTIKHAHVIAKIAQHKHQNGENTGERKQKGRMK